MKRKIILLIFVTSLFAENTVSSIASMTMPSLRPACSPSNISFELYKGSTCGDSYKSTLKPRCIELSLRRLFGEAPDVKYYNHEEAIEYFK